MDQETREKLKHIAAEIGILAGMRERANSVLTKAEECALDRYQEELEDSAKRLIRVVELSQSTLSKIMQERT